MEEQFLFPALLGASHQGSVLPQIMLEHSEERALVSGIEDALRSKRGMAFAQGTRRLLVLLRDHLDKEDVLLRSLPETSLSREQDDSVVAEFTKHRIQPEIYLNLSRLESKYTPKPRLEPLSPAAGLARVQSASQ
jgi:hemerythrin-like domain-containing protein